MADAAQYAIDIAAEMTGGDMTLSELDQVTGKLDGAGLDAQHFQLAMQRMSRSLDDAAASGKQIGADLQASATEFATAERAASEAAFAVEAFDRNTKEAAASSARMASASARLDAARQNMAGLRTASDDAAMAVDAGKVSLAAFAAESKVAAAAAQSAARANAGVVPDEVAAKARNAAAALAESKVELTRLQAAAKAAGSAVTAGASKLTQLEASAARAGQAAAAAKAKVAGLSRTDLAASSQRAAAAVAHQAAELAKLERASEAANAEQKRLGKTMRNVERLNKHVNDRLGDSATKLSTFRGALGDVGGPLGELGERALYPAQAFVDLREKFGLAAAAGTVAVVSFAAVTAALAALAAITAVVTLGIAALGVKLADGARAAALQAEALEAMHPELRQLAGEFDALTDATGQSTDSLRGLTQKLTDAKVAADELPGALRAAALAESALGAGGADQFIADLKKGKLSVSEFANTAQTKFGGVVARQMLGLEAQGARLKRNMSDLFSDLGIDPALAGLQTLVGIFDKAGATGKAIKFIFETIFQPLIDQAESAAYVVEAFIIGALIGLTKLYIQLKPTIALIADLFGFEDTSLQDILTAAKNAGEIAAYVFAGFAVVVGVVTAAVALAAVGIGSLIAVFLAVPAAILAVVTAIILFWSNIKDAFSEGVDAVSRLITGVPWGEIGADMMRGLARGILAGGDAVLRAVGGTVEGAINRAKSMLGIASPSKVFAGIGEDTGEGFAVGVEDTTADTQQAMADMVEPPKPDPIELPGAATPEGEPVGAVPAGEATPTGLASVAERFVGGLPDISAGAAALPPDLSDLIPPSIELPSMSMPDFPDALTAPAKSEPATPLARQDKALSGDFGGDSTAAASAPQARPESAARPVSQSTSSVSVKDNTFIFNGVENSEHAREMFEETLTRVLEGDAEQLGAQTQ